ncbi:MAG: transglycosylase [Brevundimonas sp.]|uniref:transglycosylase n=1 Tax=Brevundimonas sp. TaxID=1871086 RepID=UPI00120CE473|nr:transglycosylase [Brevundimonas sp.]RZJ19310.1 MAG: transglycosylase [Brevundimonas sp.]
MQYTEILIALVGVVILAVIADQLSGRRGVAATLLVSGVGAACGAFLAIRVFAISTLEDWTWLLWALVASVICLVAYFLFRNKR